MSEGTTELSDLRVRWEGDSLCVGAIWIGFVGYDIRKSPNLFGAYLGGPENVIGWFPTKSAAREEIERFVKEGPDNAILF